MWGRRASLPYYLPKSLPPGSNYNSLSNKLKRVESTFCLSNFSADLNGGRGGDKECGAYLGYPLTSTSMYGAFSADNIRKHRKK